MPTSQELLDAVEAAILGTVTSNQQSLSIAGRSLTKLSITDLLALRQQLRREVRATAMATVSGSQIGVVEVLQ